MAQPLPKKPKASEVKAAWSRLATAAIAEARQQKGLTYKQLSRKLADIGVKIDPKTLNNRVIVGQFTLVLAMQIMYVLEVPNIPTPTKLPRIRQSS